MYRWPTHSFKIWFDWSSTRQIWKDIFLWPAVTLSSEFEPFWNCTWPFYKLVFLAGHFPGCIMSFKEIYEIYLEKYMLELRAVLQAYREEKRSMADRRGSSRSTSSMSIHGDDLIVYKLCFLATVSLEMTVVKVLEQNSNGNIHCN